MSKTTSPEWIKNPQTAGRTPHNLPESQMVEVMFGDGDKAIGAASEFGWGWHREEHKLITHYRLLSRFAAMEGGDLLAEVGRLTKAVSEAEITLKTLKADRQLAFSDLNRRLTTDCGVTLNDVLTHPNTGPMTR